MMIDAIAELAHALWCPSIGHHPTYRIVMRRRVAYNSASSGYSPAGHGAGEQQSQAHVVRGRARVRLPVMR